MKRGVDYKLNAKPMLMGFYHDYVFEGPCRMGSGVMLTKEFDLAKIAEAKKKHMANIEKHLSDVVNLMPAYEWDRNEEFLLEDEKLEEVISDAGQVDIYLVPPMSRNTDILIAIAERTKKPIVITPPATSPGVVKNAAALHARDLEVYTARSWSELVDQLEVLRVKKAVAHTKVLCAARFGTSQTPSAGDNLIHPEDATKKLGIRFQYVNCHELLDQTHVCDPSTHPTSPGRLGLNPTEEDVEKINQMVEELVGGAEECQMKREEVFHSFRAYLTIRKMLEHYGCNAFCAPCPDICATRRLNEEHFTFCMDHSLLNERGIPSACEYDMCSVVGLTILENFARAGAYMGNAIQSPYSIKETGKLPLPYYYDMDGTCDKEYLKRLEKGPENIIFVFHAVANRKMHGFESEMSKYSIRPFTGSGWGVTIRYDFNQDIGQTITMCRIDPSCRKLFVAKGEIVAGRGQDDNGCSIGVFVRVKDGNDFFRKQLYFGNHMPLVYGDYFDKICQFGQVMGFEVVTA